MLLLFELLQIDRNAKKYIPMMGWEFKFAKSSMKRDFNLLMEIKIKISLKFHF
jgi:hypothetical protein